MRNKSLKKTGISAFDFFCIGFGAIVGVGWAVSINNWMGKCGGPLPAGVGYLLCLIMLIPVALCYCELCPMLPVAGGGMAYAYKAFNEKISFISGWAAFGGFVTIIPWEAIYVVDILSIMFPALKAGAPLYTLAGAEIYLSHIILGVIFSIILFAINWKGASASASLQRILCIFLIGAGILAMVVSLIKFDASNYQPIYENVGVGTHKSFMGGALAILTAAPFFLCGFETIPQAVEEAGGKIKSVGKTVVLSVGLACVFYALLLFTLGGATPWQGILGLDSPAASNMFKMLYSGPAGIVLYYIILIGAICGLFTTWNGFMMASPLLMMSMARANMIPKLFAKQHAKYNTPSNGLIACLILSCLGPFLGMGLIDPLTSFSGTSFVISWLITSLAAARLRRTHPTLERPYKMPGGAAMAWFASIMMAIVFVLLLIPKSPAFMGWLALEVFAGWMVLGVILFIVSAKERHRLSPEERAEALFSRAKKD